MGGLADALQRLEINIPRNQLQQLMTSLDVNGAGAVCRGTLPRCNPL